MAHTYGPFVDVGLDCRVLRSYESLLEACEPLAGESEMEGCKQVLLQNLYEGGYACGELQIAIQ